MKVEERVVKNFDFWIFIAWVFVGQVILFDIYFKHGLSPALQYFIVWVVFVIQLLSKIKIEFTEFYEES